MGREGKRLIVREREKDRVNKRPGGKKKVVCYEEAKKIGLSIAKCTKGGASGPPVRLSNEGKIPPPPTRSSRPPR